MNEFDNLDREAAVALLKKWRQEILEEKDPVDTLIKAQPLSDRDYYALQLARRLPALCKWEQKRWYSATGYQDVDESNPQARSALEQGFNLHFSPKRIERTRVLVHQARFLIEHGEKQPISFEERRHLYGDDDYIATMIVLCQYFSRVGNQRGFDDCLWRLCPDSLMLGDSTDSDTHITRTGRQNLIRFVKLRFDVQLVCPAEALID